MKSQVKDNVRFMFVVGNDSLGTWDDVKASRMIRRRRNPGVGGQMPMFLNAVVDVAFSAVIVLIRR